MNVLRSVGVVLVMSFPFSLAGCGSSSSGGTTASTISGAVTTLAGTAGARGSTDATGAAAKFNNPYGLTKVNGNLYVTDLNNNKIRKIVVATGEVTTIAGTGSAGNADGPGAAASFNYPFGITNDGTNLYVTDTNNHTIRKIVIATGAVSTIAGTGAAGNIDGTGVAAAFDGPSGIISDGTSLYVADTNNQKIRKMVIATGAVSTMAALPDFPISITTDGTNLYVGKLFGYVINKVVIATGAVSALAGSGTSGNSDGTGSAAGFGDIQGITTNGTTVYAADTGHCTIRKIDTATGAVTTIAGTSGTPGSANGTGSAAQFNNPLGLLIDGASLYVADNGNHTIRMIQ